MQRTAGCTLGLAPQSISCSELWTGGKSAGWKQKSSGGQSETVDELLLVTELFPLGSTEMLEKRRGGLLQLGLPKRSRSYEGTPWGVLLHSEL